jgi:hypothetical protein
MAGGVRGAGNNVNPAPTVTGQYIVRSTRANGGTTTPTFINRVTTNYSDADIVHQWDDTDGGAILNYITGRGRHVSGIDSNTAGLPSYGFINAPGLGILMGASASEIAMTDATAIFFRMSRTGNLDNVTGTGFAVAGTKVVGARGALITAASAGNLSGVLNSVIAALVTHGLVSAS